MLGLGNSLSTYGSDDRAPWNPLSSELNLALWLTARAQDLELDGTAVTNWTDRVAGLVFEQGTANRKPAFSAANEEITFATSPNADYLQAGSNIVLDTSATGWTLAWYGSNTDWDSGNEVMFGDDAGNNDFIRHDSGANTMSIKIDGQTKTFSLDTPSALVNDTLYHIMLVCQTDGSAVLYIDNVAQSDTETIATSKDFEIQQISGKNGSSQTWNGPMKEIMVFRSPLNADDKKDCHDYMKRLPLTS